MRARQAAGIQGENLATQQPESAPSAGRPRSEEAHQAILDATLELLAELGFSALTVEGVASRAGVGKATIYRRWASKLPLVVEAFGQLPALEDADTGSVERDLKTMLRSYLELFHKTSLATVLPSLAGERAHNSELSKIFEPVMKGRRQPLVRALAARRRPRRAARASSTSSWPPTSWRARSRCACSSPAARSTRTWWIPIVELALAGLRQGVR